MTKHEAIAHVMKALYQMNQDQEISQEAIEKIFFLLERGFNDWQASIAINLESQIDDWNESFSEEEEDKSLYTLGLYRAIDLVLEKDSIKEAEDRVKDIQEEES